MIHAKEVAQARNHEPFEFFGYSDHSWDCEGLNLDPVTGDFELAKGIFLYETPGHTVGHYSLLLKPEGGSAKPLLFAFDVAYTAAALEKGRSSPASTTTRTTASSRSAASRSSPPSTAPRSSTRTTWTPGTATATPPTATRSSLRANTRGPR